MGIFIESVSESRSSELASWEINYCVQSCHIHSCNLFLPRSQPSLNELESVLKLPISSRYAGSVNRFLLVLVT